MNESAKMILTLVIVSVLSAGILTIVYEETEPLIEKNSVIELDSAFQEVLPAAAEFNKVSFDFTGTHLTKAYKGISNNNIVGYVFISEAAGFSGSIRILVGTDRQKITAVKIIGHSETPGLGSRVAENAFLDQFREKLVNNQDFDAITGATISSEAVIRAVQESESFIRKQQEQGKLP
jgi:Na+-translocating ferredoxin:NAD+ oxidoreductase subunit G